MAATAEGVFRIIDRASPAMRGMERQAIKTDAAIKKLGMDLDQLGARSRIQKVDNMERSLRNVGNTAEASLKKTSRGFQQLDRDMKKHESTWGRLRRGIKDVFSEISRFARPAGMLAGMGTLLGLAAQGVGALSGGVISLIPRLTDLTGLMGPAIAGMTGLGVAMATTHLAFKNVQQAMQGNVQAMRSLTPAARIFVRELRTMRPMMREFTRSSQGGLFAGIDAALSRVRVAAPTINRVLAQMSGTLGGLASAGARRFTTRGFLADFQNIAGQGAQSINRGGRAIFNLIDGLRNIAVAARPFTNWITNVILGWTRMFVAQTRVERASGALGARFDRTKDSLRVLGHFLKDTWEILKVIVQAARPLGDVLWNAANRSMDRWILLHKTLDSRSGLTRQFLLMAPAIRQIARLAGGLAGAIFRMGTSQGLPRTVSALQGMVPTLEKLLNTFANTFGPPMARTLTDFANLIGDLSGTTGPFVTLLDVLDRTLKIMDGIIRLSGPFGNVFTSVFSAALISRYLIKLGLLEKGWWRVAGAAQAATVAEGEAAAAGGGGMVGPVGRGFFGMFRRGGGGTAAAGAPRAGGMTAFGTLGRPGAAAAEAESVGVGARALGAAGVAGRFFAPLAAISAGVGAATAPMGGGFGTSALSATYGALNGLTLGAYGGLLHSFGVNTAITPEQQGASRVTATQRVVTQRQQQIDAAYHGLQRLNRETDLLRTYLTAFRGDSTQAAAQYRAQLGQEINARTQLITQIRGEARSRGVGTASNTASNLDALQNYLRAHGATPLGALTGTVTAGLTQIHRTGATVQGAARRGALERTLLAGTFAQASQNPALMPAYNQLVAGIMRVFAAHGHGNYGIHAGQIYTGTRQERMGIQRTLSTPLEVQRERDQKKFTRAQMQMVWSLIAANMDPQQAVALVRSFDAQGGIPRGIVRSWAMTPGAPAGARTSLTHATGGRIGGSGIRDTVPIFGGMGAPGELVVNKHTERDVDAMLGRGGALAGMVYGQGRSHSSTATFARGGRLGAGITSVGNKVLSHFPGLSVTSTTGGTHAKNSYHYRGMAEDLAGSSTLMNTAARWIAANMTGSLLEGIHNPGLSVKNGRGVPSSFWGSTTWAGHRDHIHLAAGGAAAAARGGSGGTTRSNRGARGGGGGGLSADELAYQSAQAHILGLNPFATTAGQGAGGHGGGAGKSTATGTSPSGSPQQIAHRMLGQYGWGEDQWGSLQKLWTGESSWNPHATNPSSGAYGIPQALPASKMASAGPDWKTNPATQIKWGMNYIHGRYGSPSNAYSTWLSRNPHWYNKGGRLSWGGWHAQGSDRVYDSPTLIGVGEGGRKERVTVTPEGKGGGGGLTQTNHIHIHGGDETKVRHAVEQALIDFSNYLDRSPVQGADIT